MRLPRADALRGVRSSPSASGVLAALALISAACRAKPIEMAPEVGVQAFVQAPVERLAALRELRGNVVVLEFWATWCRPCRETLPHMNKLVARYADRPVRFIAVSTEDPETVRGFLRENPMRAWVGLDRDRRLTEAFRIRGIPQVVVIDPYGRIRLKVTTSFFYSSDIDKALKAKPPAAAS